MPLKGQVIIITGASSGIGQTVARDLATSGAKLMLAARREDRLQGLQWEVESMGGTAAYCATDVTSAQQMQHLASETVKTFGRIDVLFNNAGVMPLSRLEKLKVDEWDRMIDINIKGVLYGIAAVLPHMKEQGSGHIITTASTAGHMIFPGGVVYCATKHAVRAISEGIRIEMGDAIRSTIISPGSVKSELLEHITDEEYSFLAGDETRIAMEPEIVAKAVRFALEQPNDVNLSEILIRPAGTRH